MPRPQRAISSHRRHYGAGRSLPNSSSEFARFRCLPSNTFLLRPVNGAIALVAVLFNVVSLAVELVTDMGNYSALIFFDPAGYLKVFDARQLEAFGYVLLRVHEDGFGVSLIFFGFVLICWGYLAFKSGYFPKTIGVLLPIGGICYIVNSLALFFAPRLADAIFPFILLPSFIAELSFCLYLIVVGVNLTKWNQRS